MKVNFGAPLTTLSGQPIVNGDEVMTLGVMAINVLLTPLVNEHTGQPENLPAMEKVRFAKLAQDIYAASGPIDISVGDVALLKDRIGRAGTPLAVARAWALLDPSGENGNTASDRVAEHQDG